MVMAIISNTKQSVQITMSALLTMVDAATLAGMCLGVTIVDVLGVFVWIPT